MDLAKIADQIIADVKSGKVIFKGLADVAAAVKNASGFLGKISAGAKAIGNVIYAGVKYVEDIALELKLAGNQKKELAVLIINQLIDLPLLSESMEAVVIGFAVDVAVAVLNNHSGHGWLAAAIASALPAAEPAPIEAAVAAALPAAEAKLAERLEIV